MTALIRQAADNHGRPRFIVTDHGTQFRKRFDAAMKAAGITHVRGRVHHPFLNGKIERFFRTLRSWWRFVLPRLTVCGLQAKLDIFREWYNEHRVHGALGPMTPIEFIERSEAPTPVAIRQRDHSDVSIEITRRPCRGDPRLPIIDITLRLRRAA
jgi:transposase InsO family protein